MSLEQYKEYGTFTAKKSSTTSNTQEENIMSATNITLGQYMLDCLKREGLTEVFGIPGDYNFTLLDTLEEYEGLEFITGRNELNAGYAADSYARIKGLSALITTFGVGEMSACNAIAGAYSESVPIIHIVGAPKSQAQQDHQLMHHSLLDGNYDVFRQAYEPITAYNAVVTPENAMIEIPQAIHIAKTTKKPVYLVVALDHVLEPITTHIEPSFQISTHSNSLQAAVKHAEQLVQSSNNGVLLSDSPVLRYQLQMPVQQVVENLNIPAASMMMGKSGFDERHPNYIGMYGGTFGSEEVRSTIENADFVIAAGLIWSDLNTANFTAELDFQKVINIQPDHVKIGESVYPNILAKDMLEALAQLDWRSEAEISVTEFPYDTEQLLAADKDQPLQAGNYYPRFQQLLAANDIVIAETGTFTYGISQLQLPEGATYIGQAGWQSIGYATPAAFGACIAAPKRRVLLFTGDGSLQLTVQEISSMLEQGCKPIIFVLNNKGYTIEKYLNVKVDIDKQVYNDIPRWHYTKLIEAFGGDAYTMQVHTNQQLDQAIQEAEQQQSQKLCLIEMMIEDPMDAPKYLRKTREFLQKQEQQQ